MDAYIHDTHVFHCLAKTVTCQGVTALRKHPLCNMYICSKFHGNPSNSCGNTSVKNQNVNIMVALEKKPGGSPESSEFIIFHHECLSKMWSIHPVAAEMFQSGSKCWIIKRLASPCLDVPKTAWCISGEKCWMFLETVSATVLVSTECVHLCHTQLCNVWRWNVLRGDYSHACHSAWSHTCCCWGHYLSKRWVLKPLSGYGCTVSPWCEECSTDLTLRS